MLEAVVTGTITWDDNHNAVEGNIKLYGRASLVTTLAIVYKRRALSFTTFAISPIA